MKLHNTLRVAPFLILFAGSPHLQAGIIPTFDAPKYEAMKAAFGVTCDLDLDGFCTCDDIDAMTDAVGTGVGDDQFDLNGDGAVDVADREVLILDVFDTTYGDSNLDGRFDPSDFVKVFQAGLYGELSPQSISYCDGDWNGDGVFDSGDLVFVFQEGGYVPESYSLLGLLMGTSPLAFRRGFRRR